MVLDQGSIIPEVSLKSCNLIFAQTKYNMSKNTEIKFVGQPIFKQIINLVNKVDMQGLINKHNSDYYYKAFKTRTHLFTMLFEILSRCDSMNEICEGLRALDGRLNHLRLDKAPAKSIACDGLRNRDSKFFEDLYFSLVKRYHSFCRTAELMN